MNAASAPYLVDLVLERLLRGCTAGRSTPSGHGSSTGAATRCVSSGVSGVVAGRSRSCARERSGPEASIRL